MQRSNRNVSRSPRSPDGDDGRSSPDGTDSQNRSRRRFLGGTVAACAAGIGLTSTASASSDQYGHYYDDYSTVVDVTEAGADNTGNKSITPVLEKLRGDDTLLVFPEGRYYMDEQFRFTGFENFGVVGENATLVPADFHEFNGPRYRLFRLGVSSRPGGRVRFEGFDVDQRAPDTGIRTIETYASERLEVRDITIHGQHDSGTWGPGLFNITDPDGHGIVERFRVPDGAAWINNTPNAGNNWRGAIGIEATLNEGTLTFKNCWVGPFPSNGLYASGGNGKIIVEGGWYWDSNGANVRVGGNHSEIRWPTVEIKSSRPEDTIQRAIRVENGRDFKIRGAAVNITSPMPSSHAISVMNTCESVRIEGTTLDIRGDDVNHGIVCSPVSGDTTIVDTTITHETSGGYPLWIRNNNTSSGRVLAEYLTIDGKAGEDGGFRDGIRCERDNCRFNVVDVEQQGRAGVDRNAIVNTAEDLTVYRSNLRASKYPFLDTGSESLVLSSDLESSSGLEAACLYASCDSPSFKGNRLVNGIRNLGASDVTTWKNTYQ